MRCIFNKLGQKMGIGPRRNLMHIRMRVQVFSDPDRAFLLISQQLINLDKKILECAYGYLLRDVGFISM